MSDTPNLELPYLAAGQAQKHVTLNESLRRLDAIVQIQVANASTLSIPSSPVNGQRFIVATGAGGAWSGRQNSIAVWEDGAWAFYTPQKGWIAWVDSQNQALVWNGTEWAALTTRLDRLGINATASTTQRLAVASQTSLLNHDGASHRLSVNKAAATDTASVLFQSNFVGNAEIGLAGSTDFSLRVSPDGSTFRTAITADRTTGHVSCPENIKFVSQLTTAQTLAANTWTRIAFNAALLNVRNAFNPATGRVTFTNAGLVMAGSNLRFKATTGTPTRMITKFYLNGVAWDQGFVSLPNLISQQSAANLSLMIPVSAGDILDLWGYLEGAGGQIDSAQSCFWGASLA